jgi:hypothetical protein
MINYFGESHTPAFYHQKKDGIEGNFKTNVYRKIKI